MPQGQTRVHFDQHGSMPIVQEDAPRDGRQHAGSGHSSDLAVAHRRARGETTINERMRKNVLNMRASR